MIHLVDTNIQGGETMLQYAPRETVFGRAWIAGTTRAVMMVSFAPTEEAFLAEARRRFPAMAVTFGTMPLADAVVRWCAGDAARDIPVVLQGTPFQREVWRALLTIPRGSTVTYGEVARHIGRPRALRAVGTAVGQNPIGYLIPCHRVVRGDGTLGNYHWGSALKASMLEAEGVL